MAEGCCTGVGVVGRPGGCAMCNPAKYPAFWAEWRKRYLARQWRLKAHRNRPRRREAVMATRKALSAARAKL